ncbi:Zn-dependent exopeptidases superfamily protein [Striga hermonthica]|uniref:Vacuolar membrane protease n=1 Tax=Striga hermonthica TaxID=68872 RepID=A0A9N7RDE4_STRHE|nr:Zn-dependent exopeptidases superfamily protein [Striga hermonthica]
MKQRPKGAPSRSNPSSGETKNQENSTGRVNTTLKDQNLVLAAKRSSFVIFALLVLAVYGAWGVYHYQFERLPIPLSSQQVGKRGFSEHEALKHVKALARLGPHPVGSDALESALMYVREAAESIKKTAHWEVDVEVDLFHAKSGANNLVGGLFKGKTHLYADLYHIVLRIMPKYGIKAEENSILVSSHIDTVFAAEGAGDCSSCVAVMLELARGVSQWAHGFKNSIIFLFNTGEEEGLNGAHSFITQHPWSDTVRLAIDLEALGIGGKSGIFQAGPHPWAIENYASVVKYPSAQIIAEDVFTSGAIKSGTDFQVYKELAQLSGLDFAFTDNTAVYHTKNDKLELLKPGSLQHLGENMLAFLLHAAASSNIPKGKSTESDLKSNEDKAIYFDILGTYMITFRQRLATMIYNSVVLQSLLIWTTSVFMGGYSAAISVALSFFTIILMWIFSISFSSAVAFILPLISSSSAVPFVASPWLVVGLFGAPAFLGALTGQHIGFRVLESYLANNLTERRKSLSAVLKASVVKLDAERWLFKAGLLQWLVLLMAGSYFRVGSTYLAFAWLVSPAFSYGLLEATLSPARLPKPLKTVTLIIGLLVPFLLSSGMVIKLTAIVIGSAVRTVRNPGITPEWMVNIIVAVFIAAIEANDIGEGFVCGKDKHIDFVTFSVNYSCWSDKNAKKGWALSDIPTIHVDKDSKGESRFTQVTIDTRASTRWSLGINVVQIEDFQLKDSETSEELIPAGEKSSVDGWHTIQFSGGKKAPTKFALSLFWAQNSTSPTLPESSCKTQKPLLRLRTDVDKWTPQYKKVLEKLPKWCSLFGKSTSPQTFAFLSSLRITF